MNRGGMFPLGEKNPPRLNGGGGGGSGGASELMLMLLADARLPTGAHTQSAGLEPAMRNGVTVDQVPDLIAARLATVTAVEAGTAVVARHLTITSAPDELAQLLTEADFAWQARTISPAIRDASIMAARGYLRLLRSLWPDRPEVLAVSQLKTPCRAVVLGLTASICGLSAAQLVRLIGTDDAATVAAAVLKIEPVDPIHTTRWVLAAHQQIEALAELLAPLTEIQEIPALAAPLIEEWAEIHASTTQRLFRA